MIGILTLVVSYFNFYILIGLIPVITVDRFFAKRQHEAEFLLSGIVLSLAMLSTNFADLGMENPLAKGEADEMFSHVSSLLAAKVMDLYSPNRADIKEEFKAAYVKLSQ